MLERMTVVRRGTWLYAGVTPVEVRVFFSPETWGTGDYEDEEDVREDRPVPCYLIAYESAGEPGRFHNSISNLPTLAAALAYVEAKFPGLRWIEG
jgi:hypothetical protein